MSDRIRDDAPIGVFDSGFGGLTVLRQLQTALPNERYVFFGDRSRCPYGPRPLSQVNMFVQQICQWFVNQGAKLIVIACNTATVAGLEEARKRFDVPILGVIVPGARGAVEQTRNKRVGVIATQATVNSNAYVAAIHSMKKDVEVSSVATPRFVEIVEHGLRTDGSPWEGFPSRTSDIHVRPEFRDIARAYLDPLRQSGIDTLVLACTHFPLLAPLISDVIGDDVTLVDPAAEVSKDAVRVLAQRGLISPKGRSAQCEFYCSGNTQEEFKEFASRVLRTDVGAVGRLDFPDAGETS